MIRQCGLLVAAVATILWTSTGARAQESGSGSAEAADSTRSLRDGVFSELQVDRGENVFYDVCSVCHEPADFTDAVFLDSWIGASVGDLFTELRGTMPEDNPGSLKPREYLDVLTYIFHLNGLPTGEEDLKSGTAALAAVRIEKPAEPDP